MREQGRAGARRQTRNAADRELWTAPARSACKSSCKGNSAKADASATKTGIKADASAEKVKVEAGAEKSLAKANTAGVKAEGSAEVKKAAVVK